MKPTKFYTIYYALIPVLILSGIIFLGESNLESCSGLVGPVFLLLKLSSLIVVAVIILIFEIYKFAKRTNYGKHRLIVILLNGLLVYVTIVFSFEVKEWRLNNAVLNSTLTNQSGTIGKVKLLDADTYYALYGHIDWSCSFVGTYVLNKDTLTLKGNPIEKSDGVISNKYLLTKDFLIPIKKSTDYEFETDSLRID